MIYKKKLVSRHDDSLWVSLNVDTEKRRVRIYDASGKILEEIRMSHKMITNVYDSLRKVHGYVRREYLKQPARKNLDKAVDEGMKKLGYEREE